MTRQPAGDQAASNGYCWRIWLRRPGGGEAAMTPEGMTASEQMFFLGAPLAHVTAYEHHLKTVRARKSPSSVTRLARLIKCSVDRYAMLANPEPTSESTRVA